MRLLFTTDWHLAERPPLARSESYCEDLWAKMEEIKALARTVDVTLFGGDLLHWPRPNDTSHRLVRRLIEFLRDWPTPMLVVVGNHDLPPEGIEGLYRAPLGVVLEALKGSPVQRLDETEIGDVAFKAVHWSPEADRSPEPYRWRKPNIGQARVQMVHGMVMPPGGGWPFEAVGMDQIETDADLVLIGHPHWRTGEHHVNGKTFFGPGAIARTSRTESEMRRHPSALIVTLERGQEPQFEEIPLRSVRPAEEVFVWQEERAGGEGSLFAGYVAALETGMDLEGLSVDEAVQAAEQRVPPDVMVAAKEYLRRAGL